MPLPPPPPPPLPKWLALPFALCVLANLLPIWTVRWLPMGDLFGHVQLMDIVLRYDDPATVYSEVFVLPRTLDPNTLSLWFARCVPGLGALAASRLLMSAYVVGLPLSLAWLARVMGRSPFLALLAVPMTWNPLVNIGFLNYVLALPVLFCVLALARRVADRGGWLRGVLLCLLLVLLFFCHVIAFLIGMAMATFVLLWHGQGWQRLLRLWAVLAAAPIGLQWVWRKFVALEATAEGRTFGTASGDLALWFLKPRELVAQLYEWAFQYFRDGADKKMAWTLLALWLTLLALGWLRRGWRDAVPWQGRSLEVMTLITAILYFFLPSHMNEMSIITERVVVQTLLLLALWPQLHFRGWQRWLLVPIVALALGYAWVVRAEFARFERMEVGNLADGLRELPQKSRFCYVLVERDNDTTYMGSLWHLPRAIFALQHGGRVDDSFAVRPYTPVQYRPGVIPNQLIGNFWNNPHLFEYDHVLVRNPTALVYAESSPHLKRIWQEGHFWLYRVVPGDRGEVRTLHIGGSGGTGEFSDCPRGFGLSGVSVQQQDGVVRSLAPLCTAFSGRAEPTAGRRPEASAFARVMLGGMREVTAMEGRRMGRKVADAENVALSCPAGTWVVGLTGRAAAFVDSVSLSCARMPWSGAQSQVSATRVIGGDGGSPYALHCDGGQVAVGAEGSFGEVADQIGLACAEWSSW